MKKILVFCFLLLSAHIFAVPKREMRAVWIASVNNIDWPSKKNLSGIEQKIELTNMLDRFQQLNINTVFIQIRPTADAFYPSEIEPWSLFLSGTQGEAPMPFYDPLQFIIEEAHSRCIDVHAWLNPYRATMDLDLNKLHFTHQFFQKPYLFVEYGGKYYFDPGYKETRDYLNEVVADLVSRYDVDAIHFDDYFYPYRIQGREFPDTVSFAQNSRGFSVENKADWRRQNVSLIIAELQQTIKRIKPWVEFGISPFGVWRNADKDVRGSKTKAGMTNYDDLYADILAWLKAGYIDYVVPQLYWEIGKAKVDYRELVDWWSKNCYGKNLYIGLFASGLGANKTKAWNSGNELIRQMRLDRTYRRVQGEAFYSAAPFLRNPQGLLDSLAIFYREPALPPINPNIEKNDASAPPESVRLQLFDSNRLILKWNSVKENGGCQVACYVVYAQPDSAAEISSENIFCITADTIVDLMQMTDLKGRYKFGVSSVNRYKQESVVTWLSQTSIQF